MLTLDTGSTQGKQAQKKGRRAIGFFQPDLLNIHTEVREMIRQQRIENAGIFIRRVRVDIRCIRRDGAQLNNQRIFLSRILKERARKNREESYPFSLSNSSAVIQSRHQNNTGQEGCCVIRPVLLFSMKASSWLLAKRI